MLLVAHCARPAPAQHTKECALAPTPGQRTCRALRQLKNAHTPKSALLKYTTRFAQVKIQEFFGGASCNPFASAISVAHVTASAGFAEEWQTPAFDEYCLILTGSVSIENSHGEPQLVKAGQAVYLAKGERVRWVFPEDTSYVPICLPAFSPVNCHREEDASAPRPSHDAHTDIYHLVQKQLWDEHKASGSVYYPPTYAQDGFIHATADPAKLLGVAVSPPPPDPGPGPDPLSPHASTPGTLNFNPNPVP